MVYRSYSFTASSFFSVIELNWILTRQLFLKLSGLQLHLYFAYNEIWCKITLPFDACDQRDIFTIPVVRSSEDAKGEHVCVCMYIYTHVLIFS